MLSVENQLAWMPTTIGGGAQKQNSARELALSSPEDGASPREFSFFGDDGFSFGDLIDVVNPLQHIPFVSTFYREATGDDIAAAPRVMGSTLFFGPLGLAGALANVMVEESTGMDIGQHMASWIAPGDDAPVQTAANNPAQQTAPAPSQTGAEDPVLSWARGEADWARRNAEQINKAQGKTGGGDPPSAVSTDHDGAMPDAAPLLNDPAPLHRDPPPDKTPPHKTPDVLAEMAVLSNDIRSAARAYEVAANLRPLN